MTNPHHLPTILVVIEEHRPSCFIVHMDGNDLDGKGNAVENVVFGLTEL